MQTEKKFRVANQIVSIKKYRGIPPPFPHALSVLSNSAKHQLDSQVKVLSRSLTFTEDAFARPSSCVTRYSSAKHNFWELFQPGNLDQSKKDTLSGGGGRSNIRGSGMKHLSCNLDDSISTKTRTARVSSPYLQPLVALNNEDIPVYCSLNNVFPSSGARNYVRDLNAGAKPVHPSGRGSIILLDNNTKYKKVLQKNYPQPPEIYLTAEDKSRRFGRWLDLPQPLKVREARFLKCLTYWLDDCAF